MKPVSFDSLTYWQQDRLTQRRLFLRFLHPRDVFEVCASEVDGVIVGEVVRLARAVGDVEVVERFEVFREAR